ncbi:MAG: phage tail tape measure protein [Varibaculum sp.]|nr:phage tail tape measure protein [Varibaculum sp.]
MGSPAIMAIKIVGDSTSAQKALTGLRGKVHDFSTKFGKFGPIVESAMIAAPAAIAAGAVAIGKGLYDIGAQFDDMEDTIRTGTGATGAALDGLTDSAKKIATSIPTDFATAGKAIADVNTRMGLTGKNLETVSSQILEAGRLLGEDVDINSVTGAFNAFNITGADTSKAMDTLFRVSQGTGIGLNDLAVSVQKNSPAFTQLGFSFEQSAAMIGMMDKAGLDASATAATMSKALVTLAKDGEAPQDAFRRVTGEIGNLIQSGNQAGAINLAGKLFGTRGATKFVQAIQSGVMNLDELSKAAVGSGDTILDVGKDTADAAEKWQILKNNAMLALEPLGSAAFGAVGDALGVIAEWTQGIDFSEITQGIKDFFAGFTGGATIDFSMFQPLIDIFGKMRDTVITAWPVIVDVFNQIKTLLLPAIQFAQQYVLNIITVMMGVLSGAFTVIKGIFQVISGVLSGDWSKAWEGIKNIFAGVWTAIKAIITGVWGIIKQALSAGLNTVRNLWTNAWNNIKSFVSTAWNGITGAISRGISTAVAFIRQLPGRIKSGLGNLGGLLAGAGRQLIQGLINGIKNMMSAAVNVAKNVGRSVVSGVKGLLGIHSPSRVFADIGSMVGAGFIQGLDKMAGRVEDAAVSLVNIPSQVPVPQLRLNGRPEVTKQASMTPAPVTIHLTVNGALDELGVARKVEEMLQRLHYSRGQLTI